MKKILLFGCFLLGLQSIAQKNTQIEPTVKVVDSLYREDHFYIGISHLHNMDTPEGYNQNKISLGFKAGFLRDIPISKNRKWAIAPGVGIALQNINNNLLVINPKTNDYLIEKTFNSNSQRYWALEIPLEFRWRSSTIGSHKFWRIYTGIKYSYIYSYYTNYSGYYGEISYKNDPNINKNLFTTYLATGFNTWNLQIGYTFTPFYKDNVGIKNLGFKSLHLGLMFYIL